MKYKLFFIPITLLFMSCSATIVYSPKTVTVSETGPGSAEAAAEILGSDLTGAQQSQEAKPDITIPFPIP